MEVILKLVEANSGGYGIMNAAAVNEGFDPFWEGNMFFHDVFEHWFEQVHPDFRGDSAFNIGGEIAATGACLYYMDKFSVPNRPLTFDYDKIPKKRSRGIITPDGAMDTTHGMICDIIQYDVDYFSGPLTNVPRQKEFYCPSVSMAATYAEGQIEQLTQEIEGIKLTDKAKLLKKSYTKTRVRNLLWWGANMAKSLVPCEGVMNFNRQTMIDFIDFWDEFCYRNSAKDISSQVDQITINLELNDKNILSWSGTFRTIYDHREVDVKSIYCIEDFYEMEPEEDD